ncbi:hypothetical protein CJF32_00008104 [Rutstroemia sp. NJR-2017a WRK4]|nr:hypothetical protein CJF32_00008104 [Rutstroemia sp. NJR-2017a WRK4]
MTLTQSPQPPPLTSRPQIRNPPSPAPAVSILQSNPFCISLSSVLQTCESSTPNFTSLPPTQQAPCLCYTQTTWLPTNFDKAVASCAEFAATALPGAYSALKDLEGFCASVGDVLIASSSTMSSSISITASSIMMVDGSCSVAMELLKSCGEATKGFMTLGRKKQAECLCYGSGMEWTPRTFDEAVEGCEGYARTAAGSGVMGEVEGFEGLCAGVGDVRSVSGMGLGSSVLSLTSSSGSVTTTRMTLRPSATFSLSPASGTTMDRSIPTTMTTSSHSTSTIPTPSSTIHTTTFSHPPSILTTPSTTTRITPTTSAAVFNGNQDGDIPLTQVSDPMIIAVSFACAALVLFLC